MTPRKLPSDLSGREVRAALERAGFTLDRQRGSHMILYREHRVIVVPDHKQVRIGTLRHILRQADLTVEEFVALL